jgi:hypothetical protein
MRFIPVFLLLASIAASQNAWRYVPSRPTRVISMEWRKVLESPYSAQLRRELPADAAAALGTINIIEGIERVVLATDDAGPLIVLEGNFDRNALKGSAATEGAVVTQYRDVELIGPAEPEQDDVLMALVSAKCILLGYQTALTRAIDRAPATRPINAAAGFDLWISAGPSTTGWHIGDRLRVFRNGSWDSKTDKPQPEAATSDGPDRKIRIYGLEDGVREVDLGTSKQ